MLIENGMVHKKLREVILSKKCFVFIGSGLSSGIYHSWFELVNTICERCGITRRVTRDSPIDDLLEAAHDAKLCNRDAYYRFLGEHFGRSVDSTPVLYDLLLSLPFASYLTVNYDPLLALKAQTARLQCVLPVNAYPSLDRRKMAASRSIHYLHGFINVGTIPIEGTIVLARDEFAEAYSNNSSLMNLIVPTLENDPILFIGCGLREPAMPSIFAICKKHQQNRQRIMAESGKPHSNPPARFILLPRPEVTNEITISNVDQSLVEIKKQQAYYSSLEIEAVWYEVRGNDHSALRIALEQVAGLPDVTPDHGWQGGLYAR